MKYLLKYFTISIFVFSLSFAQRTTERMVIFNPLFNTEKNAPAAEIFWINSLGGWGEFGNYLSDPDETHEWYQKLGFFMEFFRTGDKRSLSVISNIEFIADPHNDINFNPRAIFWEEAFLYTQRTGSNFWQAGYYHRCKHDIDNLDYGTERSLIYGSIMGRYIHTVVQRNGFNGYASLRGEVYTILQDYRKPGIDASPNTNDLTHSIAINIGFRNSVSRYIGWSASAFFQLNAYSKTAGFFNKFTSIDYAKPSAGVETGAAITGNARFSLTLRYEYFSDTGLNIIPVSAHLLSLGVSLYPPEIW